MRAYQFGRLMLLTILMSSVAKIAEIKSNAGLIMLGIAAAMITLAWESFNKEP